MQLGIVGINHKLADVELREWLARACQNHFSPAREGLHILLSTCNRTEIYFWGDDLAQAHSHILGTLRADIGEGFEHKLYSYFGIDCFLHLARVTSGLDSAVIGETEIQGQVKLAYESARATQKLPAVVHFLFQRSLGIGKKVRSQFQLGHQTPDFEGTVVRYVQHLLGDLEPLRLLFVGASAVNVRVLERFRYSGARRLVLCNRTESRGRQVAERWGLEMLPMESLQAWSNFDVVFFGTKSPKPLIRATDWRPRAHKPLVMDFCVPRNVDPALSHFVHLVNIDEIDGHVVANRHIHRSALTRANGFVAESVASQTSRLEQRHSTREVA